MTLKKTPLNLTHRSLGARMVQFGGWDMPVQYHGVLEEHRTTREKAGLFDVSHMGEIEVEGAAAAEVCQRLITNDVRQLKTDGQILYSPICYPDGGTVDDVLLHRMAPNHFLFVVNAANIEKDFAFMREYAEGGAEFRNVSDRWAQIALQGPRAESILKTLTPDPVESLEYYTFQPGTVAGIGSLLARTGYTGEDGFELYVPAEKAEDLWNALMEAGEPFGMQPVGLGARDTLRLEMGYPLYGHELAPDITPLEAGLGWAVKFDKGEFVGRAALLRQQETGVPRELVGFKLTERGVPRDGYTVWAAERPVGRVTSGTLSPTLNAGIGLALVERGSILPEEPLAIEIRGRKFGARLAKPPFVPSHVKRKARKI